jgi:uncharacterized protein YndB with AHSA1/START domain
MWFEMRREGLEFLARAPVVHVAEADVPATRNAVFAAFADPALWPSWFPNVRHASYTSPRPHSVGTIREASVAGTHWVEEMIAWDAGSRLAWTVIRASVPLAKAQVEEFAFVDAGAGTRVRWTLAIEPRVLARLGSPLAAPMISRLFRRAMANLGDHLRQAPPPPGASVPVR